MVSRKNPVEHAAHLVPFDADVQPDRQAQSPLEPHCPLMQLQLDGGFGTVVERQRPVPEIPWSHEVQPDGQGWQDGPKKPDAHCSHEDPEKPVGHEHVPDAVQTPLPEHGGEQVDDSALSNDSEPEAVAGS